SNFSAFSVRPSLAQSPRPPAPDSSDRGIRQRFPATSRLDLRSSRSSGSLAHPSGAPQVGTPAVASMAAIPEQIIERVREQTDIVDVIGRHVGLKRSGKQWKGLCPFHDEKSPSFYVDPVRRSYKCFGCGEWGDVFTFVQKVEGVGFLAAVRSL